MTIMQSVRKWLVDNPGWHFASDVADALGAKKLDRRYVARTLRADGDFGNVDSDGEGRARRFKANERTKEKVAGEA